MVAQRSRCDISGSEDRLMIIKRQKNSPSKKKLEHPFATSRHDHFLLALV
jgi:hypothetical protein